MGQVGRLAGARVWGGGLSSRPACGGGGALRGLSSHPLFGPLVRCGSPWPCVRGVPLSLVEGRLSTLGGRRRTSWTHRLLPAGGLCGALPVVLVQPAWEWWGCAPARCGPSWTGARDGRQMMSAGLAGRWGLHGFCPWSRARRLNVLREAVCGCCAETGQGSLSPGADLARRPAPLGCKGCLGPSMGRMLGGGFCMCRRGNPPRVAAPGGILGSYGVPFAWGAPGPLGTVVVGVTRCVPGSPGTQGWPRF